MGSTVKFNWVLQIETEEPVNENHTYQFEKIGNRMFPIDTPIDLIDLDRNTVAKIKITSFMNISDLTSGSFEVIKIYTGTEKSVLTNYWIENQ